MSIPAELRYAPSHEWLRQEADGSLTVGITHHAQDLLGDLVYVELPAIGRVLAAEEACAVVESVKAASDVYAPLAGTVIAINDAVTSAPEGINEDPYAHWMFRLQPQDADAYASLLSADDYAALIVA